MLYPLTLFYNNYKPFKPGAHLSKIAIIANRYNYRKIKNCFKNNEASLEKIHYNNSIRKRLSFYLCFFAII